MMFSPYYIIIAIGCFIGAVLMIARFRKQWTFTLPAGILLLLGGIYFLCRAFIKGFAESPSTSWVVRGALVAYLIYLLLCWNNLKAERGAEFDAHDGNASDGEQKEDGKK